MIRTLARCALGLLVGCGGAASPKPAASATEPATPPKAAPAVAEPDDNHHCGSAQRCETLGALSLMSAGHESEGRAMLEKGCTLGSNHACVNLGKALYNGVGGEADRPRAVALWTKACTAGDGEGCSGQGDASVEAEPAAARKVYERGCTLEQRDCCANLALMSAKGTGGPKDERGAATAAEQACKSRSALGCLVLGLMKRDGVGTTQDPVAAKAAFHTACQAGRTEGCKAEEALAARNTTGGAEGTMSAGSVTVDGQTLKALSCEMGSGGPLGMLAISAGLRARKAQLDACATGGETETKVVLHAKGGRFAAVEAKGKSPAVGKCVERALLNQRAPFDGNCSVTVVHGKK